MKNLFLKYKGRAFTITAATDIGSKSTNQDSIAISTASTGCGDVAFCIICDGVGGLECGEFASCYAVKKFSEWFSNIYPTINDTEPQETFEAILVRHFQRLVEKVNKKLYEISIAKESRMGTTLTCILVRKKRYYICHIGDTRVYRIDNTITQLTNDHTLVAREILLGNLTREQARTDKRRHVLLKCVGAKENISADFYSGNIDNTVTSFLMCSDGLRNEADDDELYKALCCDVCFDKNGLAQVLTELTRLVKERGEKDNITAGIIQINR